MSAETLRQAAALMRERATTATPGPWRVTPDIAPEVYAYPEGCVKSLGVSDQESDEVADTMMHADAEHIASWHPTVALAVADCIDAALCYFDPDEFSEAEREMHDSLLTLARAYLNESA